MRPAKAALLAAAAYAAGVLLFVVLLVAGALLAGNGGAARAEAVLLLVLCATAFGFLAATAVAFVVLGRAGVSGIARLLAILGYGLLCTLTLGVMGVLGAVVFNR